MLALFVSAAERLRQTKPYINQRRVRMRGLQSGESCLAFLNRRIPKEANYWETAIMAGQLTRSGKVVNISDILRSSDELTHTFLENAEPAIPTDISIIYHDDELMVIHKPAGLPVHPCGRYNFHTFTRIAKEAWPELALYPVHRLDSETSGLLILAKTQTAAKNLGEQFSNRSIDKTYLSLVEPAPAWTEHCEDSPVSNKAAVTNFICLARLDNRALIMAKPISGRTNQIRVHLGHTELYLHAWKIRFKHPSTNLLMELSTALPPWAQFIEKIVCTPN